MSTITNAELLERTAGPLTSRVVSGLHKIGLVVKRRAWRNAGPEDAAPLQMQILALLRTKPDRATTVSVIAQELAVRMPTVSEALQTLQRKRMIRKARRKADRRVVTVQLTAKGEQQGDTVTGWSDFLAHAAEQLPVTEQVSLLRTLVKLVRALQERGEIPVARMCVTCQYFRPHAHKDAIKPHHCDFANAPFGDRLLRIDCAEHQPASAYQSAHNWQAFTSTSR